MTAALALAARGMSVFPLKEGTKDGQVVASWPSWATTDAATIIAEWAGRSLNVGIACGPSNLLVIDEDTADGFGKFAASIGESVPDTYTVTTGRGRHFYFAAPVKAIGNSSALKPYGCDVRGNGGYVLAAGSVHPDGSLYKADNDLPPADCPDWLSEALTVPLTHATAVGPTSTSALSAVPEVICGPRSDAGGERHDVLYRYAASMRARDIPVDEADVLMCALWQRCEQPPVCLSPMPVGDAVAVLADVYARYPAGRSEAYRVPEATVLGPTESSPERAPVDWAEFFARPKTERVMVLPPIAGRGELVRLYAQAKVGKSLLVQEGVIRIVTADQFLGHQCEPVDVVYVDQENTEDDWRDRLDDLGITTANELSRLHWYSLQTWPPLDTPAGGTALMAAVARHSAQVVVIDTQSKVTEGDENDASTPQRLYQHTFMPLKRAGVAAIVLDHAGNDPMKPRGASGKRDDMDAVWRLTARGKDRLTLECTHSRRRIETDKLYLYRRAGPLRHIVDDADAREEEFLARCTDAISFLDPVTEVDPRTASARAVAAALKAKGKGFRDKTVRDALRRYREMIGDSSTEPDRSAAQSAARECA